MRGNHMALFRTFVAQIAMVLACTLLGSMIRAQTPSDTHNNLAAILQELLSLYPTAKATADGTDLVTAGAVLVLQKDNLMMNKVDQPFPLSNNYKDGAISQGGLFGALNKLHVPPPSGAANPNRTFVAGEKFFVTKIIVRPDSVEFNLMSDPIQDQRYHSILKFPFAKGTTPMPDDVASVVSQALKVDDASGGGSQSQSASNAPPAAAPTETKKIEIGQTRDQVIAVFGVPSKIVQLGKKEIDYFPDMKVTFVQNKVTDVN
jgi:hypothetical protein